MIQQKSKMDNTPKNHSKNMLDMVNHIKKILVDVEYDIDKWNKKKFYASNVRIRKNLKKVDKISLSVRMQSLRENKMEFEAIRVA